MSVCEQCGAEFGARRGKRFCGKRCRQQAYRTDPAIAERARAYQREYRAHPEKRERERAVDREYYRKCRREQRTGWSAERFARALINQRGVCAIPGCGATLDAGRGTQADHCHSTGQPRALLCLPCNVALGIIEHRLAPAWRRYIRRWALQHAAEQASSRDLVGLLSSDIFNVS